MKDSSGIEIKDASKITNSYLSSDKEFFSSGEINSFHSKLKYKGSTFKLKEQQSNQNNQQNPSSKDVPSTSNSVSPGGEAVGGGSGAAASSGVTAGGAITTVTVTTVVTVVAVVGGTIITGSLPKVSMLETNINVYSYEALFSLEYNNDSTLLVSLGNATQKYSQTIELKTFKEDTSTPNTDEVVTVTEVQRVLFNELNENTYYTFEISTDIGFGEKSIYKESFKTKAVPKDLTFGSISNLTYDINYESSLFTYNLNILDPANYLSNINVKFTSLFNEVVTNDIYEIGAGNTVDFGLFTKGYTIKMEVFATSSHPEDIKNGTTTNVYYEEAIYY